MTAYQLGPKYFIHAIAPHDMLYGNLLSVITDLTFQVTFSLCARIQRTVWEGLGRVLGIMKVTELKVVILPVNRIQ